MSSSQSLLVRRPLAVALVVSAATALSLFVLFQGSTASTHARKARRSTRSQSLQRSGAVRRRRPQANVRLLAGSANEFSFGTINVSIGTRNTPPADLTIPLLLTANPLLPPTEQLVSNLGVEAAAADEIRRSMVKVTLDAIFAALINGIVVIPDDGQWTFLAAVLESLLSGVSSRTIAAEFHLSFGRALHITSLEELIVVAVDAITLTARSRVEQLGSQPQRQRADSTSQNHTDELKGVLYYIAEEQAKRKAYQHRGIRCEECGESPIRNIRWHCLHCADYDLCSTCKSLTTHKRNHIFAEIRIPLPVLAQPTIVLPAWYPGSDIAIYKTLSAADRRSLAHAYDCDEPEIDALAEQFVCFANAEAVTEPSYISASINRFAFGRAISSEKYRSRFHSNLFCNQMFDFYDSTRCGHIGFEQFVSGSSFLRSKKRDDQYLLRSLDIYDLNEDGLVCRSFFLRVLKAKYDLHRVLIADIAEADEAERTRQNIDLLHGYQPIGTLFHGDIPQGTARGATDKRYDQYGDAVADKQSPSSDTEKLTDIELLTHEDRQVLGLAATEPEQRRRIVDETLLWEIIDESLDEVLDIIFGPIEARLRIIKDTALEREHWRELIEHKLIEMDTPPENDMRLAAHPNPPAHQSLPEEEVVSLQAALQQGMISTDNETLNRMEQTWGNLSLDSLLESSGYSILEDGESRGFQLETSRVLPDPTMPQNKPDNVRISKTRKRQPPDEMRLRELAKITLDERNMVVHNNEPYLTKAAIVSIAKADASGAAEGLIRSWVGWAAF